MSHHRGSDPCAPAEADRRYGARGSELGGGILGYVFPGAGHLYAHRPGAAAALAGAATSGMLLMFAGVALFAGAILSSAIDAPRAVRRYNERLLTDPSVPTPRRAARRHRPSLGRMSALDVRLVPAAGRDDVRRHALAIGLRLR